MNRLNLGVARRLITPSIGGQLYGYSPNVHSATVADDLTATAFYFTQKDRQALLISLTVCLLQEELCKELRERIEAETDIPAQHVLLCATHTHSGPNTCGSTGWGDLDREYCDTVFLPRILDAAKEAKSAALPVSLGVGVGNSTVGINRRPLGSDNIATLGQNPWGCYDPAMTLLSFRNDAGAR